MKVYWHVMKVGIQNTLVYRVNFLIRAVFSLVPLMATIAIWRAIYEGNSQELEGYTLSKMISYYLIVLIIDALTGVVDDDWQVAADIREGNISQFLLKPIHYLYYRFCLYGAGRLVYASVAAIPIGLFLFYHRESLFIPTGGLTVVFFLISLSMAALLQFLISYTMALLSFWLLEVSTLILMLFALEYLAGGHLFPLDLLPGWIGTLLSWTPFPCELYVPAGIYLEQITGMALAKGLGMQALWVIIVYGIAQIVWLRGVKHYSAFGG